MKSDERHQLQQNELSKIGHQVQDLMKAPFWDKYNNHILIGISVVCLGAAAWIYWSRRTQGAEIEAWREVARAEQTADFASISMEPRYAGTTAAPWATLRAAELYLQDGVNKMFTDREGAAADLDQARSKLDELLANSSHSKLIRERALFALGQTLETQNKLDEAQQRYEQLLQEFPATSLKVQAEERLQAIKSGESKAFYAWFAKQKPKPVEPPKPKDDTGSLIPGMPNLDFKDIPFPTDTKKSKPETTTEETTTDEKPASSEAPKLPAPSDTLPETKPATDPETKPEPGETTSTEEKPAQEKPSTEANPDTGKPE